MMVASPMRVTTPSKGYLFSAHLSKQIVTRPEAPRRGNNSEVCHLLQQLHEVVFLFYQHYVELPDWEAWHPASHLTPG